MLYLINLLRNEFNRKFLYIFLTTLIVGTVYTITDDCSNILFDAIKNIFNALNKNYKKLTK